MTDGLSAVIDCDVINTYFLVIDFTSLGLLISLSYGNEWEFRE